MQSLSLGALAPWRESFLFFLLATGFIRADEPDILIADFEGPDYGAWKVTGEAFGNGPAQGTLPNQMPVDGFLGKGLVNSYAGGDGTTGTLTSPPLKVQRKYIHFLIGGGQHPGKTCINLLLDGKVVRTATGPNDKPGGSEHLDPYAWDVSDLAGKMVVIEIVDQATGGWGHINLDHIVQTDMKLLGTVTDARREIVANKRYLNLPVKNGATKKRVKIFAGGEVRREFEIELADGYADWWAFLDLTAFTGQPLTIEVDKLREDSNGLSGIDQSDDIRSQESLYREKLRPWFHFSSRRGWLNDPNGMVYFQGEYHLYYQHNPYGWAWGNMHWGHAVSRDLVHWKELPIALYPKQFGDWAFSGSAVVDPQNTSGFGKGKEPPLIAAYTSTGRGECIVYSNDRGRTWQEFQGNPVVKHRGRDPRLFWHEPTKRWCMAVYHEEEVAGKVQQSIDFHSSPNLKEWRYESRIDGFFECPDIYELPVEGDAKNTRWVLSAANSDYVIGRFDGHAFVPEAPTHPLPKGGSGGVQATKHRGNFGNGFYAAQTFSDAPDGRRIIIGWLQSAAPGMPFNQMMSFPCELSLKKTPEGVRLSYAPVKELEKLHAKQYQWQRNPLPSGEHAVKGPDAELLDVRLELEPGDAEEVALVVRGVPITYSAKKAELACSGGTAPVKLENGKLRLQALVDRTSVEIFASRGLVYMPLAVHPKEGDKSLRIAVQGGAVKNVNVEAFELKSAWEGRD